MVGRGIFLFGVVGVLADLADFEVGFGFNGLTSVAERQSQLLNVNG